MEVSQLSQSAFMAIILIFGIIVVLCIIAVVFAQERADTYKDDQEFWQSKWRDKQNSLRKAEAQNLALRNDLMKVEDYKKEINYLKKKLKKSKKRGKTAS